MALVTDTGNTANNGPQFQPGQDMASPDLRSAEYSCSRRVPPESLPPSSCWHFPGQRRLICSWRGSRIYEHQRCLLVLGIAMLIAWREGNHAPNIAIALALTFIYGSVVVTLLFDRLHVMPLVGQIVRLLLFFLRPPSTSARHSSFRANWPPVTSLRARRSGANRRRCDRRRHSCSALQPPGSFRRLQAR